MVETELSSALEYLEKTVSDLLKGCRIPADNGINLYTPDGSGSYKALWTRDFAYMVLYAGDLLPRQHIQDCIEYLFGHIREDCVVPDRIRADEIPVYVAGPESEPLGEPNIDNAQFLVIAAGEYLNSLAPGPAMETFRRWEDKLDKCLDYIPLSSSGLVYNDPEKPHSPYGFTDTVCKTGELFMESLLMWLAGGYMAEWYGFSGEISKLSKYRKITGRIENSISSLWDEKNRMFFAAAEDCRQIDVWGNAFAVYIDFPLNGKRDKIIDYLFNNRDNILLEGQVRHLIKGEYWERMLLEIPEEQYQNGAYWATASGWILWALAQKDINISCGVLNDLMEFFKKHGFYECINKDYCKINKYVTSGTNPLGAVNRMLNFCKRKNKSLL